MLVTSDDDLTVLILDNNEAAALTDLLAYLNGGLCLSSLESTQLSVLADLAETMGADLAETMGV